MGKLLSGRYFLTVVTGLVFLILACNGKLPDTAVVAIITNVFTLYFTRADRNGGKGRGRKG